MIGTPDGNRAVRWDVPRDPTILGDVRGMVRQALTSWELADADDLTDDIVLAMTEVLSNAVLYGLPPIRLTLRVTGETLSAEVTDHGAGRPERVADDDEAEHGRGLTIVEALSDEWGVLPEPDGTAKTVWFRKNCLGPRDASP
ncbi:ATP-binding protein [Sphaerisporangium corydalis]|uniref:ATP-binding protein n=1 Tax=Sphaerisporangium corydalis TaxID=1441875 RepID=A0ABV9E9A0_9ACTN|nr:ATP-binding protein [Sphaerisporangium corydalis]